MKRRTLIFTVFISLLIHSCGTKDNPTFQVKPAALGIMNDIVVICDQDVWDGPVGDSLDYFFGGAFPLTPSPEPIFDLRHFTPKDLEDKPLKKELRTYLVVADLNAVNSPTTELVKKDLSKSSVTDPLNGKSSLTTIGKDKWANGQILVYLLADNFDNLAASISTHFPSISTRVLKHDAQQLRQSTYTRGNNGGLSKKVEALIGREIDIPFEYVLAKESPEENMLWLRKDTKDATVNLVFRKEIYVEGSQTSKANMKALRDDFGRKHISSDQPNSYMKVNDKDLPILEYTKEISGLYTKEYRGIWEMENDFMGGPFITWMIVNGDEMIYIDGSVWAPGKRKRELLQQLELIANTLR